ncbi:MAG: NRDE family protein [Puniceicoccaceae bacterium]
MCTLAWGEAEAGFLICFNRDEQRSRPLAEDPRLHPADPVPLIYACDPQGGGTWFAASTRGFAVALLNNYPGSAMDPSDSYRSRGELVLKVASMAAQEAAVWLEEEDFSSYAPFFLFILDPEAVLGIEWDGKQMHRINPSNDFWTTSSHQPEAITAWRRQWWNEQFHAAGGTPLDMAGLMRRTHPGKPSHGLTMDRPDARTLSQIELLISTGTIRFTYRAREPEGQGYREPVEITHHREPPYAE